MKIATQYQQLQDWKAVKQVVIDQNILQKNKVSTIKREYVELEKRLALLTNTQLDYLLQTNRTEQQLILFWTICQYYQFISDFTLEVVRNKALTLEYLLEQADYNWFFQNKTMAHPELEAITDGTQKKVRSTTFLILAEAGLINNTKEKWITPPFIAPDLAKILGEQQVKTLQYFLLSDRDIPYLLEQ